LSAGLVIILLYESIEEVRRIKEGFPIIECHSTMSGRQPDVVPQGSANSYPVTLERLYGWSSCLKKHTRRR